MTTPNILTEVCDYLGQFSAPTNEDILTRTFSSIMRGMEDKYTESSTIGQVPCFRHLGLADSSIVQSAKGRYLVLTEDVPLWEYLRKNQIATVNFAHLCYP